MESNRNGALSLDEVRKRMLARTVFNTYEICYSFDSNENKYASPSDEVLKELFEWYDHLLPCLVGSKIGTDKWKDFAIKWMKEIMPKDTKKGTYVMKLNEADLASAKLFEAQAIQYIRSHEAEKEKMLRGIQMHQSKQLQVYPVLIIPKKKDGEE